MNNILLKTLIITTIFIAMFYWFYLEKHSLEFDNNKNTLIKIHYPSENDKIKSPLIITGKARGQWYFEATFPVVIVDWDGLIIAQGYAQALEEWMTEDFVPFEGKIEFKKPNNGERGAVIFQKSNTSGLPEHDDAIEIPILFDN